MCFDVDSRPPIAPMAGGAIDSERVVLQADDGNRFAAFRVRAAHDAAGGAGVLVLPDVRGLHRYYEELALRFAEAGFDAIAIDYFGRTAGAEPRGDDFEFMPHVGHTTWSGLQADLRAAAAELRGTAAAGGTDRPLFTVGFCFGGRVAFLSAATDLGLAGAVGFYGNPVGPSRNDTPPPVELVPQMRASILGVFGGDDAGIPETSVAAFEDALTAEGVDHEIVTYPGAPHSFFDRKFEQFADESADAWRRVLAFIRSRATAG
jgi:carboxymethylenebutenolidase